MRADAASVVDRYGADLTRGACLHAAAEAAAEKQRRRRLAMQVQNSVISQRLVVRLKVCQRGFVAAPLLGVRIPQTRP